ncbi:uridine kinase [Caldithrix abyssi]|uniref:Uridine kinase n=1 Tax=Caldithrix abyssi DSM 13497 TaxID=880073 RepID=H1XU18_CALAY|nr:uridine kinase [Caldithrix abyssi]APF16890.1 udk uridine kinase [Caldithrix abyssi DSM 13497]EHO40461.1 Uridine kinase [Caldithrix abyssi DSM 13497]
MKRGILIGIAGASGSGKTLVANTIIERLGSDKVVLIQEDSYYKDLSDIPLDARAGRNFDHPDAFDHDLLAEHLTKLLQGKTVAHPIYDYKTHSRLKETRTVGPHTIVILEGILVLNEPKLRNLMDIRVFIDTALDICFIRRLQRDIEERGRSVESVITQYENTVRPMYFQFIEPSKRYADIIIPRGGKNLVAIDILTTKIRSLLLQQEKINLEA